MATPVFLVILVVKLVCANDFEREGREGFIDRLSGGMKFASDFLASESVASKVAEFVVRAFQTANTANQHQHMPTPNSPTHHQHSPTPNRRRPIFSEAYEDASSENLAEENRPNNSVNEAPSPMTPLKYLVKLIGLQPNQISAVAVNALVFVAQMISTFLAGPPRPSKPYRTEDPTSWILNKNSRSLQDLLERAKNESILHDIDEAIKQQDEDTSCIRLLVCKITPFVHKMQDAVFDKDNITDNLKGLRGADIMYRHLPTAEEIRESGDTCEQKHKDCDLSE
ncbi:uncharacterized protein LOC106135661 [Amyelois transitella]|uniref:uncharacterized protein LOC106135661 n=1 Tax=Amyelois transitella TaxID=680683 RepID=UPI00298F4F04|nr:uncharacterized protein LOC106135661 [Amyelois transitella]